MKYVNIDFSGLCNECGFMQHASFCSHAPSRKPKEPEQHGFYSKKMAEAFGHSVYRNVAGEEVFVTVVYATREMGEAEYRPTDKAYVGVLTTWLRRVEGRCPSNEREFVLSHELRREFHRRYFAK